MLHVQLFDEFYNVFRKSITKLSMFLPILPLKGWHYLHCIRFLKFNFKNWFTDFDIIMKEV